MAESSTRKRVRRDPADARELILDTTERLMAEEGYAAVTTRRVAKEAELTSGLVHYYYPTTDELFIALHRRMTDRQIEALREVLASADPLRSLWEFQTRWSQTALGVEFLAVANHRKAIREEITRRTEQAREIQVAGLSSSAAADHGGPLCLASLLTAIARFLVNEESVGITYGHSELRAFVDELLRSGRTGK